MSPLNILIEAAQSIQRHVRAFFAYLAIAIPATVFTVVVLFLYPAPKEDPMGSPAIIAWSVGLTVLLVVWWSLAQTIAFSRLGREMDRPLWKVPTDGEAIRRFLPMWCVLNAVPQAAHLGAAWHLSAVGPGLAPSLLALLWISSAVLVTPVGAAIMFLGRPGVKSLGDALRPFGRRFPQTVIVMITSGAVFFFADYINRRTAEQVHLRPVIDVAFIYFDCLIFSASWLLCKLDRDRPDEEDDFEF